MNEIMPKLIIHVGMPKAGSTALQERLSSLRGDLIDEGVLYPSTRTVNHNFLIAGAEPAYALPRILRQHYRGDEGAVREDFIAFWGDILTQSATLQPRVIVMSGEYLWRITRAGAARLARLLRELSDDIHLVCYVRRPSDFFLSQMQQVLKASHRLPKLGGVSYRANIESLGMLGRVHVHAYQRSDFPGGDVCLDFSERYLGDSDRLKPKHGLPTANESISSEAMAILHEYRRTVHSKKASQFTRDTSRLVAALKVLSAGDKPQLREDAKQMIDQSSTDLTWLYETHGVTFTGIDYGHIEARDHRKIRVVSDVCVIDERKKNNLMIGLLNYAFSSGYDGPLSFREIYKRRA
jgi:hypothetical protein